MKHAMTWKASLAVGALALLAGGFAACSSKSSPTAPVANNPSAPPSGGGGGAFLITVTANPGSLEIPATSADPVPTSTITVSVRSATNGNPPANGTTAVVSASVGTFGTAQSVVVTLVNGQAQLVYTPPSATTTAASEAVITATLGEDTGQTVIDLIQEGEAPTFLLDHIEPNVGDPAGGTRVTIFGQGFEAPIRVLFGTTNAQVISVSSTRAVVVVPPSTPLSPGTTQPITVTVNNAVGSTHESSDSLVNGFIYANGGSIEQPVIFTVSPSTGLQEGGTQIVITGNHFQLGTLVLFRMAGPSGTIDLNARTDSITTTKIVAFSPDIRPYILAGTLTTPFNAQVRVVNPNGASATWADQFTYGSSIRITSISPGQGPFNVPTRVTIFGSGFVEPVAVSFGGRGQTVVAVSGTEIIVATTPLTGTAIPPCNGSTAAPVSVTNVVGGATAVGASFTFLGPPNPIIFNVSPSAGTVGSSVTITGQSFDPTALRVLFGGTDGSSAPITSASTSTITVTVPTPPPSFSFNTQACDGNGDNIASGSQNLPTPISITVRNLATGCETTLSNAYTILPCGGTLAAPTPCACTGDTSSPPPTTTQCSDGVDNDADTFIDFPADLGCTSATGTNERTQCQDGIDNDSDTFIDLADPQCSGVQDTSET